jgi:hypothetical protein
MKKNKLFVCGISSLIILGVLGLSGVGFARLIPGGGGGGSLNPPVLNPIATPTDAVELSWNSVTGATSYKIYRCDTEVGDYGNPIGTTTSCTYTDYPPERGKWWYMVRSYNSAYGDSGYSDKESVFYTDGVKKIAVFFWASDAIIDNITTSKYTDVLIEEDYTEFYYYKDSQDFDDDFAEVADFERSGDIVFFYMCGHGGYDDIINDSYTVFRPGGPSVSSSHFKTLMDGLDTNNKGFLIESCYSGGWVDDFKEAPYLAISTADKDHAARAKGLTGEGGFLPGEGFFSNWFWFNISREGNYLEAFNYANDLALEDSLEYIEQYGDEHPEPVGEVIRFPQIYYDGTTYNFFAD